MSDAAAFDYSKQLLLKEIDTIQAKISGYDDLSFKIKGWAATLWSAIVVWGAQQRRIDVIGIGIIVVLAFWVLDAFFKTYQQRSMVRMGYIEDFLNGEGEFTENGFKEASEQLSFDKFPVHDPIGRLSKKQSPAFAEKYKRKTHFWGCFRLANVSAIYLGLSLAALALATSIAIHF